MKKIVFNGKPFLRGDKRGVYRYTYEILKALDNYVKPGEVEILIPNVEENLPCFKNIKFIRYGNSRFFKGWQYIFYQYYILKNKALAVSTCPELSSFITKGIVTFHDMRIERKKGLTKTIKDYIKNKLDLFINYLAIKRSVHILTVSNYIKNEFMSYYNIEENKISIIYNSWEHLRKIVIDEKQLENKYNKLILNSFYFYIGGQEKNKNIKWILEMAKKNPEELFIIAGPTTNDIKNNYDLNNVQYLGFISDEEAAFFMKHCKAFLFPSFYEGFGIPPLEALYFGAKVICSNRACLPEIYKDYVVYFDPLNYNIDLNNLLEQKVNKSRKIFEYYSWDKSAKKLLSILDKYR